MDSRLAAFLRETFVPEAGATSLPSDCWVSKVLGRDPSGLASLDFLSAAIQVVDELGALGPFAERCKREHPTRAPHQDQYDPRLVDCMTEASAFAWTDRWTGARPEFRFNEEGHPDIGSARGLWVEAKGIWNSATDQGLVKQMAQTGDVVFGTVRVDLAPLLNKFQSAYDDALRKLQRVQARRGIVFLNLIALDLSAIPLEEEVIAAIVEWAKAKREARPETGIVIVRTYDWRAPRYEGLVGLDVEPYPEMLARTRQAAKGALERYGEPGMSLEELQRALAKALPSTSLAEVILKEREAGW